MSNADRFFARQGLKQQGNKPAVAALPSNLTQQDRLMLVALEADLVRLREIQSHQRRNEVKKAELLPRYRAYLVELVASLQPRTPAIIVRNLIWAMDTGDIVWAMTLGKFAVAHNLPTPDGFRRDIRNLFVGDMATLAIQHADADPAFQAGFIRSLDMEARRWDLIDEVRADLCKASAQAHERLGDNGAALHLYQKADLLNARTRVKRDIARVKKKLEHSNAPA